MGIMMAESVAGERVVAAAAAAEEEDPAAELPGNDPPPPAYASPASCATLPLMGRVSVGGQYKARGGHCVLPPPPPLVLARTLLHCFMPLAPETPMAEYTPATKGANAPGARELL